MKSGELLSKFMNSTDPGDLKNISDKDLVNKPKEFLMSE
jgi:hypothetical protein